MESNEMSRRTILEGSLCVLASAALALPAQAREDNCLAPSTDETIRRWYKAWEQPDWHPVDFLLADDFTFTSAAGDDHISKSAFKAKCWETQINFIERFDLQKVYGSGNEAFVLYICRTKNGKSFRNVEHLRLRDGKLESIECYFGAQSSFPSAVSTGQT